MALLLHTLNVDTSDATKKAAALLAVKLQNYAGVPTFDAPAVAKMVLAAAPEAAELSIPELKCLHAHLVETGALKPSAAGGVAASTRRRASRSGASSNQEEGLPAAGATGAARRTLSASAAALLSRKSRASSTAKGAKAGPAGMSTEKASKIGADFVFTPVTALPTALDPLPPRAYRVPAHEGLWADMARLEAATAEVAKAEALKKRLEERKKLQGILNTQLAESRALQAARVAEEEEWGRRVLAQDAADQEAARQKERERQAATEAEAAFLEDYNTRVAADKKRAEDRIRAQDAAFVARAQAAERAAKAAEVAKKAKQRAEFAVFIKENEAALREKKDREVAAREADAEQIKKAMAAAAAREAAREAEMQKRSDDIKRRMDKMGEVLAAKADEDAKAEARAEAVRLQKEAEADARAAAAAAARKALQDAVNADLRRQTKWKQEAAVAAREDAIATRRMVETAAWEHYKSEVARAEEKKAASAALAEEMQKLVLAEAAKKMAPDETARERHLNAAVRARVQSEVEGALAAGTLRRGNLKNIPGLGRTLAGKK